MPKKKTAAQSRESSAKTVVDGLVARVEIQTEILTGLQNRVNGLERELAEERARGRAFEAKVRTLVQDLSELGAIPNSASVGGIVRPAHPTSSETGTGGGTA